MLITLSQARGFTMDSHFNGKNIGKNPRKMAVYPLVN